MDPHKSHILNRYVIQRHTRGNEVHWDFMLELEGSLKTWRIDVPPEELVQQSAKAQKIADHPLRFLTYEGPVNQGTGRVAIADSGVYTVVAEPHRLEICLQGNILKAVFRLEDLGDGEWRLAANSRFSHT